MEGVALQKRQNKESNLGTCSSKREEAVRPETGPEEPMRASIEVLVQLNDLYFCSYFPDYLLPFKLYRLLHLVTDAHPKATSLRV